MLCTFTVHMVLSVAVSCLSLSQYAYHSNHMSKHISLSKYRRDIRRGCITRSQILPSVIGDADGLRVFVLSDLHTDYTENMKWIKNLSSVRYKNDILIVAGDVSETYKNFIMTMSLLKNKFEHVLYVPGNHDLWCRQEGEIYLDSHQKLNKVLDACRGLGVETNPIVLDGLGIIPLLSWYHESFDKEEEITNIHIPHLEMACKDFKACKWSGELSNGDISLALYFDAMNEKNQNVIKEIQNTCSQIITFSHFVPRQELCPEKRMLFYPKLPKIIGSDCLEVRIRSIHGVEGSASACHVFGHTHFCWDAVLDGIRYVQAPLAYPRERKRRMNGGENWLPFCIYSNGKLSDRLSPCYWSDYYSSNPRTPHNTKLAPWVARFYNQT
ncbi:acyl-carrier-protein phosphodiesterase PptH [Rosa sericea]